MHAIFHDQLHRFARIMRDRKAAQAKITQGNFGIAVDFGDTHPRPEVLRAGLSRAMTAQYRKTREPRQSGHTTDMVLMLVSNKYCIKVVCRQTAIFKTTEHLLGCKTTIDENAGGIPQGRAAGIRWSGGLDNEGITLAAAGKTGKPQALLQLLEDEREHALRVGITGRLSRFVLHDDPAGGLAIG